MTKILPNPGSNAAIIMGCVCSPRDNNFGKGFKEEEGVAFWVVEDCPLHKGKWEIE